MTEVGRARQAARNIVRKTGVASPPVDVDAIIAALGIKLIRKPLGHELSGMAMISGKDRIIVLNSSHHPNRQRFTAAHELGHHLLHSEYLLEGVHVDKGVLKRDSLSASGKDLKEVAANAFAAELLMPRSLVSAFVPRDFDVLANDQELELIATKFQVSTAALSIRLINLS